jgi:predicted AlkP superfamily phosphohydrolase/phosphomutase
LPFWKPLEEAGIPVALVKLPVDFPPVEGRARVLSGLGTPDIRGSQGSFTFFTDDPLLVSDDTSGGIVVAVRDYGSGRYSCRLTGPPNSMLDGNPLLEKQFDVHRDVVAGAARIDLPDRKVLLAVGEWSEWVPISFDLLPGLASVSGMARFYLAEVSPYLKLYVSPLNMDPMDPALPISEPHSLSHSLAREVGRFYTQGFPEDTKALSRGVLNDEQYYEQARLVLDERMRLWEHSLDRFGDGFLFFYFSSLDLNMHMFYRAIDQHSPLHSSTDSVRFEGAIADLYSELDRAIGMALEAADDNTILAVFSDHGFAPYRRSFNLNSWLAEEGYAAIGDPYARQRDSFEALDWRETAAYGLGLNSLYLNLRGRERDGTVEPGDEAHELLQDIAARLENVRDPQTGLRVVERVYPVTGICPPGSEIPSHAPDAIIGYAGGYRASWETTLGSFPTQIIEDNLDPWSGTHCISPALVPGTLMSNVDLDPEEDRTSLRDIGTGLASLFVDDARSGTWI